MDRPHDMARFHFEFKILCDGGDRQCRLLKRENRADAAARAGSERQISISVDVFARAWQKSRRIEFVGPRTRGFVPMQYIRRDHDYRACFHVHPGQFITVSSDSADGCERGIEAQGFSYASVELRSTKKSGQLQLSSGATDPKPILAGTQRAQSVFFKSDVVSRGLNSAAIINDSKGASINFPVIFGHDEIQRRCKSDHH